MDIEPVRWGILGAANIAIGKVVPAMQQAASCDVVALASRSQERADGVASAVGIPRAHGSYEALLDDPDIEAVYIPLPNHLHAEWTLRAADARKHVLCEKPLALSSEEAIAMVERCDRAGVLLMEAFMYRLHPLWGRARQLVAEGRVGELRAISVVFSYFNVDPQNIRNVAAFGGGALMDIGCYAINAARMMFGSEPRGVKGFVRRDPRFGTDVLTSAMLDFDGRHASFVCSTQMESDQRVEIIGTDGRLVIEIPFNIPPDRPTRILHFAGGKPPVAPHVGAFEFETADQYTIQGDLFSRAVRAGGPVPTPPHDAVANMVVIERVLSSAAD